MKDKNNFCNAKNCEGAWIPKVKKNRLSSVRIPPPDGKSRDETKVSKVMSNEKNFEKEVPNQREDKAQERKQHHQKAKYAGDSKNEELLMNQANF